MSGSNDGHLQMFCDVEYRRLHLIHYRLPRLQHALTASCKLDGGRIVGNHDLILK
ncbi:hypothetical protein E4U42_004915 [Claviceps africana]|uniref:Uncharacterized protein n=1 Tax=Claviceps africana TaxID=83212 RepID=A0A8K0J5I4_9HYPO|nr:hypothetical protein E4U42_004915 [Claviceps africana]